jgi:hypothetical protein
MKKDEKRQCILIATPVGRLIIPAFKYFTCSWCGQDVGCSDATWSNISKKMAEGEELTVVCIDCARSNIPHGGEMSISEGQWKEIEAHLRKKLSKEQVDAIMERMKKYYEVPSYIG